MMVFLFNLFNLIYLAGYDRGIKAKTTGMKKSFRADLTATFKKMM
jgi:hypothetical protein